MDIETMIPQEQETVNQNGEINMGRNIRFVRESRRMLQKQLAGLLNVPPRTMSRIESQSIIENEELLNEIAVALDCDVNFLKYHKMDGVIKNFRIENNTQTVTSAENSHDNVDQYNGENNITNNNCPINEIKDIFLKVMEDKDAFIMKYIDEMQEMRREIDELKRKK